MEMTDNLPPKHKCTFVRAWDEQGDLSANSNYPLIQQNNSIAHNYREKVLDIDFSAPWSGTVWTLLKNPNHAKFTKDVGVASVSEILCCPGSSSSGATTIWQTSTARSSTGASCSVGENITHALSPQTCSRILAINLIPFILSCRKLVCDSS